MSESLETIERRAYRSFWNDGLLDIMLGLVMLVFGLAWWQDVAVLGAIFPPACVAMWKPLRRKLVEPRMGYVEFSGARELQSRTFRFGIAGFFAGTALLGLLVFALLKRGIIPQPVEWIAGFPLVLLGIPALLFAVFTGCRRFYLYGGLMAVAAVEVVIQGLEPYVGILACGVVVTVCGLVILMRFLARYPASEARPE